MIVGKVKKKHMNVEINKENKSYHKYGILEPRVRESAVIRREVSPRVKTHARTYPSPDSARHAQRKLHDD
jgi:hypothetical protein